MRSAALFILLISIAASMESMLNSQLFKFYSNSCWYSYFSSFIAIYGGVTYYEGRYIFHNGYKDDDVAQGKFVEAINATGMYIFQAQTLSHIIDLWAPQYEGISFFIAHFIRLEFPFHYNHQRHSQRHPGLCCWIPGGCSDLQANLLQHQEPIWWQRTFWSCIFSLLNDLIVSRFLPS